MKSFIGISICFVIGLFACQQSVGQDVDQTATVVSVSENLVAKSDCGQGCNCYGNTPVRNIVVSRTRSFTRRVFSRPCCN